MRILIVGEEKRMEELLPLLPSGAQSDFAIAPPEEIETYDLIFDLNLDDNPENFGDYKHFDGPLIGGMVKLQAAELLAGEEDIHCRMIGMNTLPTLIGREIAEWSLNRTVTEDQAKELAGMLNWEYELVADRVGMATPRIILMIINEAAYTVQEGTAKVEDIDLAMKLGTAYPYGPLEWADRIGIQDVYETLEALYFDTHDERYRACPLIKSMYLENKSFYTL